MAGFVDNLKEAFGIDQDRDEGDSWATRLKEAAYTSPSGRRLTFLYEDLTTTREKKTTAFEFSDADGTYIQDHGNTGRRYPMRIYLSGKDCDTVAEGFEALIFETGPGILEHPMKGTKDVVPFGTITRRDDLKTGGNQVIFDIVFWDTIGIVYPQNQTDGKSAVDSALDAFNAAAAAQMEEQLALNTPLDEQSFLDKMQAGVDAVNHQLDNVANAQTAVAKEFNKATDVVNGALDAVGNTAALAQATQAMIQAPGKALTAIQQRLEAYKNLAEDFISGPTATNNSANDFVTDDLFASTAVTGSVVSVVFNTFSTKIEALSAAESLLLQLDAVATWREENYQTLSADADAPPTAGAVDMGGAYDGLHATVALCVGYLVEISFTLKQERAIVTDRARTIVDLTAELYGNVDDNIDFFLSSNDFTGSEIIEVPRGRRVVYYV